jgi:hypothetical protein
MTCSRRVPARQDLSATRRTIPPMKQSSLNHVDPSTSSGTSPTLNAITRDAARNSPPESANAIILDQATPAKQKRGKSLSRRTGQSGHIEKSGKWYVVRYWKDIAGQEKREHVRERICPISGPARLSSSERKRKAKEIIQSSGVDTAEYFTAVVKPNPTGVTFREQSEVWLQNSQNRKRNPIGKSYAVTIQGALDKWILPAIGDLPLGSVDNLTVKPLIDKMSAADLSARTINKYVEFVEQIVVSLKGTNGEPVHKRVWDAETMDLPLVEHSKQKTQFRNSFKAAVAKNRLFTCCLLPPE